MTSAGFFDLGFVAGFFGFFEEVFFTSLAGVCSARASRARLSAANDNWLLL
jgi:hypothetical protein